MFITHVYMIRRNNNNDYPTENAFKGTGISLMFITILISATSHTSTNAYQVATSNTSESIYGLRQLETNFIVVLSSCFWCQPKLNQILGGVIFMKSCRPACTHICHFQILACTHVRVAKIT